MMGNQDTGIHTRYDNSDFTQTIQGDGFIMDFLIITTIAFCSCEYKSL